MAGQSTRIPQSDEQIRTQIEKLVKTRGNWSKVSQEKTAKAFEIYMAPRLAQNPHLFVYPTPITGDQNYGMVNNNPRRGP